MSHKQQPFISVVTPVHNTAEYLATCIESVLGQSYNNWEYVIVDNKSTDESLAIAEAYAAKDGRIRIINTDTLLPQAVNYNFALRQISPESQYCKMVQADDWIFPDCLKMMVGLAEKDPRIAIVGAYVMAGKRVATAPEGLGCGDFPNCISSVLSGSDACRLFFLQNCYLFGSQTSVLYRSDLVRSRNPFFVESGNYADTELCFDVLDCHLFGFIHQVLTYSRVGNESISTAIKSYNPYELRDYSITQIYALYAALARNMFRRRGPQYWEYNLNCLKRTGDRLDRKLLYRMALCRILDVLGNPKATFDKLVRRISAHGRYGWKFSPIDVPAPIAPRTMMQIGQSN
jgi:glycosyltransferase involved in cell wall biosynthesis